VILLAPVAAGALVIGACSKQDTTTPAPSSTTTTAAPTTSAGGGTTATTKASTGTTSGTAAPAENAINTKVWNSGFTFDLKDWDVEEVGGANAVVVNVDITNNGTANYTPYGPYELVADGKVLDSGALKTSAEVTPRSTTPNQIIFEIYDAAFSAEETTLVIGSSDAQQAKVPLGDPSKATTLEPQAIPQSVAPIVIGNVTLNVKVAEVRYDAVNDHANAPTGKGYLILAGTAANASATDTYYLDASQVTITRPDGTTSSATVDASGIAANTSNEAFYLRYELDTPITGTYTLTFTQPFGEAGAPVTATQTVQVPAAGAATTTTTGKAA
jgi:hypothetical protein